MFNKFIWINYFSDKMKRITFLIVLFIALTVSTNSQPWHYDFGSTTGSYNTPSGLTTSFLPSAPSGNTLTRIGTGGGSINLENQLIPFGTDTYIRGTAPTGTSVNKFGVNNYAAGKCFTIKFKVRFGLSDGSAGAGAGNWYFFAGDGAMYGDGGGFNGAQVFTGLRFAFSSGGAITTNFRSGTSWTATGISGTPFQQGFTYTVEIYGNNTTSAQTYTYGTIQSLAANKFDIWIDGILVGDDLQKAALGNDVNIDSWVFYGESSAGNTANIFVDEIDYHNDIAGVPLPVTMNSFTVNSAGRNVILNWETGMEINNSGFYIEKRQENSTGFTGWEKTVFINGAGTSNYSHTYSYTEKNLNSGIYQYRLKQVDLNGNYEYFYPTVNDKITISSPTEVYLSQNYPNPSNPSSIINYQIPEESFVKLNVYDISGKTVKSLVNSIQKSDYYTVKFDGNELASGIYFYKLEVTGSNINFNKTMKLLLIK